MEEKKNLSKLEKELLNTIKSKNLTDKEIKSIINNFNSNIQLSSNRSINIDKKTIKYGVISDTHIGSTYYDSNLLSEAIKTFKKEKVDFVIHGGDICEGHYEGKRHGSVFELTHIGGDNQINYAKSELEKITEFTPLYFITGNHENNTFYKLCGFEIGKILEEKLPNSKFLGNAEGIIDLPYKQSIMILHPDGGSSYALSYKPQKIVESLEGGKKPSILHISHFHKAEYLFYRNIHVIQDATLQSQTKFMKGNHISAHKGYFIISADISEKGILRIKPEFYPEY